MNKILPCLTVCALSAQRNNLGANINQSKEAQRGAHQPRGASISLQVFIAFLMASSTRAPDHKILPSEVGLYVF